MYAAVDDGEGEQESRVSGGSSRQVRFELASSSSSSEEGEGEEDELLGSRETPARLDNAVRGLSGGGKRGVSSLEDASEHVDAQAKARAPVGMGACKDELVLSKETMDEEGGSNFLEGVTEGLLQVTNSELKSSSSSQTLGEEPVIAGRVNERTPSAKNSSDSLLSLKRWGDGQGLEDMSQEG